MDIKEKITDTVKKITEDKELLGLFKENPIKAVEKVAGVDLPDDVVNKVVDGVKMKLAGSKAGDAIDKLKNLF